MSSNSWEYSFADYNCSVPSAIMTVKNVVSAGNFYNDFLDQQRTNAYVLNIPSGTTRAYFDNSFTGLVYNLRTNQNIKTASRLASALQGVLSDMWSRYTNTSLSNDERTKFAYLYYLTRASISALK